MIGKTCFCSYLADFADSNNGSDVSKLEASDIMSNPVLVYRLIRRFSYFLKTVSLEASGAYGSPLCSFALQSIVS